MIETPLLCLRFDENTNIKFPGTSRVHKFTDTINFHRFERVCLSRFLNVFKFTTIWRSLVNEKLD